ncbi:MAG: LysE family translocator [Oleiphilaceae bacterium]|nr:LysE family translocator [Oleiphilaceae bacterium]
MSIELLVALSLFAFVSSITPGPNNLMLMASGANFGFVRTVPHMLGVGIGFTLMVILVGSGLMHLFDAYPRSYTVLQVVSVVYLLFLAYKIATAGKPDTRKNHRAKPITFVQAVLFQWVNPKAWTMALTAISVYAPERSLNAVLLVAMVFGLINLPSVSVWTVLGLQMRKLLTNPVRLRWFNLTMAVLLVASLFPML